MSKIAKHKETGLKFHIDTMDWGDEQAADDAEMVLDDFVKDLTAEDATELHQILLDDNYDRGMDKERLPRVLAMLEDAENAAYEAAVQGWEPLPKNYVGGNHTLSAVE